MKKIFAVLAATSLVLVFALSNITMFASANPGSILSGGNKGYWQYPDNIIAAETKVRTGGQPSHVQLITNGLATDQGSKICHTFDGQKYGWIPMFMQWYNYRWHEMEAPTTVIYDANAAQYMACVNTPSNGVYALFAWYPIVEPTTEATVIYTANSYDGVWTAGTDTDIEFFQNTVPSWLGRFSNGTTVDTYTKICYPFPQGNKGWVAEIRKYQNGRWIAVETEETYMPSTEGVLNACTMADAGIVYALFGYLGE